MTTQDIAEEIIFNAWEIAEEIEDCEWVLNKSCDSKYAKEQAKITAYDHIAELIYGGEQE